MMTVANHCRRIRRQDDKNQHHIHSRIEQPHTKSSTHKTSKMMLHDLNKMLQSVCTHAD